MSGVLAGHSFSCFRLPFPPGDRVTFNGKECMCQKCSLPKSAGGSTHLSQGLWSEWALRAGSGGRLALTRGGRIIRKGTGIEISGTFVPPNLCTGCARCPVCHSCFSPTSLLGFGPALAYLLQEAALAYFSFSASSSLSSPPLIPGHLEARWESP